MDRDDVTIFEREARASAAVLRAREAGVDPYALVFIGSGRRGSMVDPVEREYPAWMLFDEAVLARVAAAGHS